MKLSIRTILLFYLSILFFERCANPTAITGGPKDTIPPTFIEAQPFPQSLNVKSREFTFTFSEPINADKLSSELLITPTTEIRYNQTIKKNILIIKFEEDFKDSTTYTFNFRKGIGDATEKNPVENLKYAFSTGPYIDSLTINGFLSDFMTLEPQKEFTVGLYEITDTLKATESKPYYFYNTEPNGYFQIDNIKAGKFLLFAFNDKNNNLLFNAKDEAYATYPDTLIINNETKNDSLILLTQTINAEPLKLISARATGKHFITRYSKPITIESLAFDNTRTSKLHTQLTTDQTELTFFNYDSLSETDSIQVILSVRDTLYDYSTDTVYVKYLDSNRKSKDLSLSAHTLQSTSDTLTFQISSSKPIVKWNQNSLFISIDTLVNISPKELFVKEVDVYNGKYQLYIPFKTDSIYESINKKYEEDSIQLKPLQNLKMKIGTQFITSVENDTLTKSIDLNITKSKTESTGQINIKITTDYTSFQLLLINKKGVITRKANNEKNISFKLLPADTYNIQIFIDSNENGIWEIANPHRNTVSEPIYNYPTPTELKSNWILDIEDISF